MFLPTPAAKVGKNGNDTQSSATSSHSLPLFLIQLHGKLVKPTCVAQVFGHESEFVCAGELAYTLSATNT